MAASLANIEKRLISRVRPDKTAPAVTDVGNLTTEVVQLWANEETSKLIQQLKSPEHFQALLEYNKVITVGSGKFALPTSPAYELAVALRSEITVNSTAFYRDTEFTYDPNRYAQFDGLGVATTPTIYFPKALIAGGSIYVKPSDVTKVYLDYIMVHPTIASGQGTVWSDFADSVFIERLAYRYYMSKNNPELAAVALSEINRILGAAA